MLFQMYCVYFKDDYLRTVLKSYCKNYEIFKNKKPSLVFLHSYAGHGFYRGYSGHIDDKVKFSNEAGTIAICGGCSTSTSAASASNNTITLSFHMVF